MSTQHTPEPQGYDGRTEYEKKLLGIIENLEQQHDELLAWKDKALEVYPNTDRLIALHVRAIAIQAKAIAVAKGDKT